MSTSSPGPEPLHHDDEGVDDLEVTRGPTSPGPDSTDVDAPTSGTGHGVNLPDTGPGPAATDVDAPTSGTGHGVNLPDTGPGPAAAGLNDDDDRTNRI